MLIIKRLLVYFTYKYELDRKSGYLVSELCTNIIKKGKLIYQNDDDVYRVYFYNNTYYIVTHLIVNDGKGNIIDLYKWKIFITATDKYINNFYNTIYVYPDIESIKSDKIIRKRINLINEI